MYLPLPAINIGRSRAAPHIAEPKATAAMKHNRIGRRPKTDTNPPTRGRTIVDATGYALATRIKFPPLRSCTIVGSAVDIEVYID